MTTLLAWGFVLKVAVLAMAVWNLHALRKNVVQKNWPSAVVNAGYYLLMLTILGFRA